MPKIEEWALKQLERTLSPSKRLISLTWDHNHLLEAVYYSRRTPNTELQRTLRNFIECHLQGPDTISFFGGLGSFFGSSRQEGSADRDRNTLIPMYKVLELKEIDSSLFGYVFCSVLKKGYTSSAWTYLTRDDRAKLLAAQVYLTPLPFQLEWIDKPSLLYSTLASNKKPACFSQCASNFSRVIFPRIFTPAYDKEIKSNEPLTAISALCKLPCHRSKISDSLKSSSSQQQGEWTCKDVCGSLLLDVLDTQIDYLFTELSDRFHDRID